MPRLKMRLYVKRAKTEPYNVRVHSTREQARRNDFLFAFCYQSWVRKTGVELKLSRVKVIEVII